VGNSHGNYDHNPFNPFKNGKTAFSGTKNQFGIPKSLMIYHEFHIPSWYDILISMILKTLLW
jgi:hypothetical protein